MTLLFMVYPPLLALLSTQLPFTAPLSSKDDYFKEMVVGTWILDDSNSYCKMTVSKDGKVIGNGMFKNKEKKADYSFKSTWEITNGNWIEKATESTIPSIVGSRYTDRIAAIDADIFVAITPQSDVVVFRRDKN